MRAAESERFAERSFEERAATGVGRGREAPVPIAPDVLFCPLAEPARVSLNGSSSVKEDFMSSSRESLRWAGREAPALVETALTPTAAVPFPLVVELFQSAAPRFGRVPSGAAAVVDDEAAAAVRSAADPRAGEGGLDDALAEVAGAEGSTVRFPRGMELEAEFGCGEPLG